MKRPSGSTVSAVSACAILVFGALLFSAPARAQKINEIARSGPYTFNLKVLSPESFQGPNAEMVRDSGAEPVLVSGPIQPNHHLVVFIKKNGKPVENAQVNITYTRSEWGHWKRLPVVRMHVAGKGPETTHFGNNVLLKPGKYRVEVRVDHKVKSHFMVDVD